MLLINDNGFSAMEPIGMSAYKHNALRHKSGADHLRHDLRHTTLTAKIKKVLLLRNTLTLWRRAAKVIAPF